MTSLHAHKTRTPRRVSPHANIKMATVLHKLGAGICGEAPWGTRCKHLVFCEAERLWLKRWLRCKSGRHHIAPSLCQVDCRQMYESSGVSMHKQRQVRLKTMCPCHCTFRLIHQTLFTTGPTIMSWTASMFTCHCC
jgi:hypothetical protein